MVHITFPDVLYPKFYWHLIFYWKKCKKETASYGCYSQVYSNVWQPGKMTCFLQTKSESYTLEIVSNKAIH